MYSAVYINLMLMLLIVDYSSKSYVHSENNYISWLNACYYYNVGMSYVQSGVIVLFKSA